MAAEATEVGWAEAGMEAAVTEVGWAAAATAEEETVEG